MGWWVKVAFQEEAASVGLSGHREGDVSHLKSRPLTLDPVELRSALVVTGLGWEELGDRDETGTGRGRDGAGLTSQGGGREGAGALCWPPAPAFAPTHFAWWGWAGCTVVVSSR